MILIAPFPSALVSLGSGTPPPQVTTAAQAVALILDCYFGFLTINRRNVKDVRAFAQWNAAAKAGLSHLAEASRILLSGSEDDAAIQAVLAANDQNYAAFERETASDADATAGEDDTEAAHESA